jgi:hypothetical protein
MLLAGALQIIGVILAVAAAVMVALPLGVAVAAIAVFAAGYTLERR